MLTKKAKQSQFLKFNSFIGGNVARYRPKLSVEWISNWIIENYAKRDVLFKLRSLEAAAES